jgi:hypothetical protein
VAATPGLCATRTTLGPTPASKGPAGRSTSRRTLRRHPRAAFRTHLLTLHHLCRSPLMPNVDQPAHATVRVNAVIRGEVGGNMSLSLLQRRVHPLPWPRAQPPILALPQRPRPLTRHAAKPDASLHHTCTHTAPATTYGAVLHRPSVAQKLRAKDTGGHRGRGRALRGVPNFRESPSPPRLPACCSKQRAVTSLGCGVGWWGGAWVSYPIRVERWRGTAGVRGSWVCCTCACCTPCGRGPWVLVGGRLW